MTTFHSRNTSSASGRRPRSRSAAARRFSASSAPRDCKEQIKLLCQRGGGRTGGLFNKGGDALHQNARAASASASVCIVLLCVAPGIASRAAGEGPAPVGGGQRPGVGIIFQCALLGVRQVNKAGFQQTQHAVSSTHRAADPARRARRGPGRYSRGWFASSQKSGMFCRRNSYRSGAGTGRHCGR